MKKLSYFLLVLLVLLGARKQFIRAENVYVNDAANLLSEEEERVLGEQLATLSDRWGIDVAVVNVETTSGHPEQDYADLYAEEHYRNDNVLLLTVMDTRYVHISTSGKGIDAFTDYGIDLALDHLTAYMADGRFYEAYRHFGEDAERYFEANAQGHPVDNYASENGHSSAESERLIDMEDPITWLSGILMGALGSTGIAFFRTRKLKTVYKAPDARNYIADGSFALDNSQDIYLYKTVSRTKIVSNSGSSSGGGSTIHHSSSGGTHGGGGRHF